MDEKEEKICGCDKGETCTCGEQCECGENCTCHENCECKKEDSECDNQECSCQECSCHEHTHLGHCHDRGEEYLLLAKQIQADFENFRRHALEDIKEAKILGQTSVIEVFLPCLDTFKEAKKSIQDEKVLTGVEMIENKILEALSSLGVEKIQSIGEVYNPHLHDVIAVMPAEDKENDIILDQYQAGYTFKGKVIRHAKVIVVKNS